MSGLVRLSVFALTLLRIDFLQICFRYCDPGAKSEVKLADEPRRSTPSGSKNVFSKLIVITGVYTGMSSGAQRWAQVRTGELRWAQVRTGELRWAQVRTGELRWAQVRRGELRCAQVSSVAHRCADPATFKSCVASGMHTCDHGFTLHSWQICIPKNVLKTQKNCFPLFLHEMKSYHGLCWSLKVLHTLLAYARLQRFIHLWNQAPTGKPFLRSRIVL